MKIAVANQTATLSSEDQLVQHSENIYMVEFTFDESWEGFSKTAVFVVGSSNIGMILTEDRCMMPSQCLKRAGAVIRIGVYGVRGDERKPTVWCKTDAVLPGANAGQLIQPPAPDVYSQLLGAIGDLSQLQTSGKTLVEALNEIKQALENGCGGGGENPDNTATDQEVDEALDDIFGSDEEPMPDKPSEPTEDDPDNTATNEEVDDMINDVFGKG